MANFYLTPQLAVDGAEVLNISRQTTEYIPCSTEATVVVQVRITQQIARHGPVIGELSILVMQSDSSDTVSSSTAVVLTILGGVASFLLLTRLNISWDVRAKTRRP
jgi:hypothetical protein